MDFGSALNHLLNLFAPAAAVAVLLALAARVFWRKTPSSLGWIAQAAINFAVGCAVLVMGLWWFGRDGKMLTYVALVLACASSQWCWLLPRQRSVAVQRKP